MACVEYSCVTPTCQKIYFGRRPTKCPACGGYEFLVDYDEAPFDDYDPEIEDAGDRDD